MDRKIEELKKTMRDGGYTCVIGLSGELFKSRERGVKPLLEFLDSGKDGVGALACDKVVGKAAAFIYVRIGIAYLYADVISAPALDVMTAHGISVEYGELTDAIRNRSGDGFCPMESAVSEISEVDAAIKAVRDKISFLNNIKNK